MPGPGTFYLGGPVGSGTVMGSPPSSPSDIGLCQLIQRATITQNGTNAVSVTFLVPQNATILNFDVDVTTAFNSATSAVLSAGTAAAGTQYMSGVDVKAAAGRIPPTLTAAQLTAMNSVGANTSVVVTVTPTGATSAGSVIVTLRYVQNVALNVGTL